MQRRDFLKTIPILGLGGLVGIATKEPINDDDIDKNFFIADANKGSSFLIIYLNGEDVSEICTRAKLHKDAGRSIYGWVDLVQRPLVMDENDEIVHKRFYGVTQWWKMEVYG